MSEGGHEFGRTIQLFLVDGSPNGLIIATQYGWTGNVMVCRQATFDKMLKRAELDRTGLYILYGPDPDNPLKMRAYIGEADSVRERIVTSAKNHGFWETAVTVTTSDDALTKGHIRYSEARMWEVAAAAGRVTLANAQQPGAERRRLPEADRANMEAFLANLRNVLPVVGLDLLKPQASTLVAERRESQVQMDPPDGAQDESRVEFEIRHKSGVHAVAIELDDEFVVLRNSEALKDSGYAQLSYKELKSDLISQRVLVPTPSGDRYVFSTDFAFASPSAAAAVVLDRNANGRTEWKVSGQALTYHEWQSRSAVQLEAAE